MADNSLIMYHVNDENKKIQLEVLCMGISVATKELKTSDLNRQIGELVGIKGTLPQPKATDKIPALYNMPEIILFSGIPNERLDEFLNSYKNMSISPTKLKAIVTPSNVTWTLYQLISQLSLEARKV
jgi:hypothetical protein